MFFKVLFGVSLFFHSENHFAVLVASVRPISLVSSTARTIYSFFEVDDRCHFLLSLSRE